MKRKNVIQSLCLLSIAFVACGTQDPGSTAVQSQPEPFVNDWADKGLVEYIPLDIVSIETAVGLKNGLTLEDFKDVHFLHGEKIDVTNACRANANGCVAPSMNVVILVTYDQDLCVLLAHELTHIALFKTTGNARNDHLNEQFEQTFDLCAQIEGQ